MAGWETADADVLATVKKTAADTIVRMAVGERRPLGVDTRGIRSMDPEGIRRLSKRIRLVHGVVDGAR